MTAVALLVALTAPVLGGPDLAPDATLTPPSIVEYVNTPDVPDPPPIPDPVVVPPEAAFPIESAASVVVPKPPPPRPVVQQPVAHVVDHTAAIAQAAASPNGQIPTDALCALSWDPSSALRCDAAAALEHAAANGMPQVALTDTYRSYADQVAVKASHGALAAKPGTSNHGEGLAIDVPEPARTWLHRNGTTYGWTWPQWARSHGETWHFLFTG